MQYFFLASGTQRKSHWNPDFAVHPSVVVVTRNAFPSTLCLLLPSWLQIFHISYYRCCQCHNNLFHEIWTSATNTKLQEVWRMRRLCGDRQWFLCVHCSLSGNSFSLVSEVSWEFSFSFVTSFRSLIHFLVSLSLSLDIFLSIFIVCICCFRAHFHAVVTGIFHTVLKHLIFRLLIFVPEPSSISSCMRFSQTFNSMNDRFVSLRMWTICDYMSYDCVASPTKRRWFSSGEKKKVNSRGKNANDNRRGSRRRTRTHSRHTYVMSQLTHCKTANSSNAEKVEMKKKRKQTQNRKKKIQ